MSQVSFTIVLISVINISSTRQSSVLDLHQFSSVQFSHSVVSDYLQPWTAARQASLSITNCWSPPKPMSIESVMPSKHLILCRPLLLLPSIFPSIRVFSDESALHIRWPKYWSFSFSISPSNEHPGLISFRMDWLDLLAVQGTLKSFLQHHSSKASILHTSCHFYIFSLTYLLVWFHWSYSLTLAIPCLFPHISLGLLFPLNSKFLCLRWPLTQGKFKFSLLS